MAEFILASASPRRKELLSLITKEFDVIVSDADEDSVSKDIPVTLYVQELALLKAAATAKEVLKRKDAIIIAADGTDGAFEMLKSLSGRVHEVYTGYCIMRMSDGKTVCNSVRTEVEFKELTDEKIRGYIATSEPMDKAGSYGIQGYGSKLVKGINGDYFNVVGLPVSAICDTLEKEFDIETF